jgi:hypothetical protein
LIQILNLFESLGLLSIKHFAALDVAHVAHVANISECEVVVEASLAGPVTNSLLDLLRRSWSGLRCTALLLLDGLTVFTFGNVGFNFLIVLQKSLLLGIGSLVWRHGQVSRHTFVVIITL